MLIISPRYNMMVRKTNKNVNCQNTNPKQGKPTGLLASPLMKSHREGKVCSRLSTKFTKGHWKNLGHVLGRVISVIKNWKLCHSRSMCCESNNTLLEDSWTGSLLSFSHLPFQGHVTCFGQWKHSRTSANIPCSLPLLKPPVEWPHQKKKKKKELFNQWWTEPHCYQYSICNMKER